MDFQFKPNKKYTIVKIGEMAVCYRMEIIALEVDLSTGRALGRPKGKKKPLYLPAPEQLEKQLLFEGHDLPFVLDSETGVFCGSATFNFRTDDPEALRDFLESKCLNPSISTFEKIYWIPTAASERPQEGQKLFEKPSLIF